MRTVVSYKYGCCSPMTLGVHVVAAPTGRPIDMRLTIIALVLCACVWVSAGDGAHLKAKAKLLGRLVGKHHKRGVLSAVPPYKLGHDIPHITHSVVKPVVVTYPPTASVTAVKVPLAHPLLARYPVPVGHRVPVPHPHYGLKFPHHTKSVVLPKPDQHYHHHHHHVAPRPVIPVVPAARIPATPVVPVAAPTVAFARPVPVPSPPVVLPTAQVLQPAPLPPVHLKTSLPAPVFNYAQQFPYSLRPGGAVQASFFANYPRYPIFNYQGPVFPLHSSSFSQIVPHVPQYPVQQGGAYDGVVIEQPDSVQIEPTPTLVHAHGAIPQPGVHFEPQPGVHVHAAQPEVHLQPGQPGVHIHAEHPDVHLHQFQPGVHLHSAQPDVHLQPGVHVQQPEVHLHAGQSDIHLQPGVQVNGHPDFHFHNVQPGVLHPGVQIQPGQPDIHYHAGQPDVHLQPGVQVNSAGQPDIHFHSGQPGFQLHPGQPDIHFHQTQPGFNYQPEQPDYNFQQLQPAQPAVDHNGWSPVPSQNDHGLPNGHYPDDGHHQFVQDQGHQQFDQGHQYDQGHQQYDQGHQQFDQGHQQFDQGHQQFDQGHQGYDQNAQDQYEYQHQLQHHIQQQLDQAQYEQHVNNQHQLGQEYGVPNLGQSSQDYPQNHQPAPQGAEGRSAEGHTDEPEGDKQLYHNHIPLGLQPPIDRPLEHFR